MNIPVPLMFLILLQWKHILPLRTSQQLQVRITLLFRMIIQGAPLFHEFKTTSLTFTNQVRDKNTPKTTPMHSKVDQYPKKAFLLKPNLETTKNTGKTHLKSLNHSSVRLVVVHTAHPSQREGLHYIGTWVCNPIVTMNRALIRKQILEMIPESGAQSHQSHEISRDHVLEPGAFSLQKYVAI